MNTFRSSKRRMGTIAVLACAVAAGATPAAACNVDAAPMSFGAINPLDRIDTDSVATLTVTCPAETAFSATVSAGGGTYAERTMASGTNVLSYQLYIDASRTLVWGDGTGGTSALAGSAGPAGTTSHIHGRVPSQPLAIPGAYNDTLVVTITY